MGKITSGCITFRPDTAHGINGRQVYPDDKIYYIPNPKQVGCNAWHRYNKYKHCRTVEEYWQLCSDNPELAPHAMADFRWDDDHDFVLMIKNKS